MRDYDPTTGRYIQADPLGLVDGASVYGYALGNPGRRVDPRGEQSLTRPGGPLSTPQGGMSIPSAGDYADAWQGLLEWSHSYNPVDLLIQAIVAACTAEDDCAEQWREAYEMCRRELGKANPNRGLTGGRTSIHGCARGLVSERCKGNPIEWGPSGPPPGWRPQ
jgi:uncharacterized protein RhaS with RHS repeats